MRDREPVSDKAQEDVILLGWLPPIIAGDKKFSKFPTSFIDPEVAFEVRHL